MRTKGDGIECGRPEKYDQRFVDLIKFIIIHDANVSDATIARKLGIGKGTFHRWKHEYEDFRNAYYAAWDYVATHGAERSLLQLATGYEYKEITRELSQAGDLTVKKEVTKHAAPDMRAIEFILKNRDTKRWPKGEAGPLLPPLELHIHTSPKEDEDNEV